ncbi:hypothetical protein V6Z11_D03G060000 [Gossypium hirsutum]
MLLLCSLPSSYKSFRETLIYGRDKLSFEDVKGHLLSRDKLDNEFDLNSKADRQASVLVASKKRDKRCRYCKKLGHVKVDCYKLVVESIGEGVTGLREGDLVIPAYIADCKTCETCMSEKTNLCLKYPLSYNGLMQDGSSRMSIRGQTAYHAFSCSTWCQYLVINVNFLLKIDPKTPLSDASFLSCGFSTGYGATWKEAMVQNGSSVAVFGLGAAIKGAKSHGAIKVIGIDNNPMKAAKGRAFGMTNFINPGESDKSIAELVKDLTAGMGVDYSFECTGVPPLINEAIQSTKLGTGKIIQMGVEEPNVNINIIGLLIGRTLKGSIFGGLKAKTDLPIIYSKCKNREIQLDELLSHEIKLEEVNKVFELLKQPDCVKILIKILSL